MYDKLKKGMDYLETLSKKSIVTVFQKTFVTFSGLLLISSLVLLVQKLPIVGWEQIIGQGTIEALNEISELGYNYISLFVIISFTFYYFKEYNENEAHDSINHLPITLLNVAIFF